MESKTLQHTTPLRIHPGTTRSEHPWDLENGGKRLLIYALTALFCLTFSYRAAAQEDEEAQRAEELKRKLIEVKVQAEEVSRRSAELQRQQQELKEELVRALRDQAEISEDLRGLLVDYQAYFAREQSPTSERTIRELSSLATQLQSGAYLKDNRALSRELAQLQEELRVAEDEFRASGDQQRAARLSRSLQRELEIYQDLMPEKGEMKILIAGLAQEMAQVSTEISHQVIMSIIHDNEPAEFIEVTVDPADSTQFVVRLPKFVQEPIVVRPPSAALPPVASPAPSIDFATPDRRVTTISSGQIRLVQKLADSVQLYGDMPVELTVPIGAVEVRGVESNWVRIVSTVEMQSNKRRSLENLGDDIRLMLNVTDGRVVAQSILPNLRSSETTIAEARTIVELPRDCELKATTSFGPVSISDIDGDVIINGHHSVISVSQIGGNLDITNRMGTVSVSHVLGATRVNNHLGTVSIEHAEDGLYITNSQAPVAVRQSEGSIEIHSDGPVDISFHSGDILVRNNSGPVTFNRIEGNIDAATAFGPATVTNVIGDVRLATVSAPLTATGIEGALTASNRAALLSVQSVVGPLTLVNDGGSIMLSLTEAPYGPSTISSTHGVVKLNLPRNADITVASRLVNGRIDTSLPVEISEDGTVQMATMLLGSGSKELKIDGSHSNVIVSQK